MMEITWKIDTSVSESSCILERTHYPELEDIFGRITPKGGRSTSAAAPSSYVRGV